MLENILSICVLFSDKYLLPHYSNEAENLYQKIKFNLNRGQTLKLLWFETSEHHKAWNANPTFLIDTFYIHIHYISLEFRFRVSKAAINNPSSITLSIVQLSNPALEWPIISFFPCSFRGSFLLFFGTLLYFLSSVLNETLFLEENFVSTDELFSFFFIGNFFLKLFSRYSWSQLKSIKW